MRRLAILLFLTGSTAFAQNTVPIDWPKQKSINDILPSRGYTRMVENGKSYWYSAPGNPQALSDSEWKSLGYSPTTGGRDVEWNKISAQEPTVQLMSTGGS